MSLQHFDKDCLYSVIKNTSGGTKKFGFLPPHGVELASDEEYSVFGNILEALSNSGDRISARRSQQALAAAIDRGDIEIINTPAPILVSPNGTVKMITVGNDGSLSSADPCWTNSDSLDVDIPA